MAGGQPDVGDVHVNALLTNLSLSYQNADDAYVADRAFPLVPVDKQSDLYPIIDRGWFLSDEGKDMVRAPGTNAVTTGYKVSNDSFFCLNYAIGHEIPDELRGNADSWLDLDLQGVALVTALQRIRRERAFAADFMTTGVWGTDVTGGSTVTKWSDYGGSNPISDIRRYRRQVMSVIGSVPNKLVLGQIVYDALVDHPDFLGRISGGATAQNAATMNRERLAALLDLDEILVSTAIYRTSAEGQAVTTDFVIDDDALLLYAPRSPGLMVPSAGYTFFWRTLVAGANSPQFVRKIREERPRMDIIEAHAYWDQVKTDANAGVFFSDIADSIS